jgi:glycosyltransferase involved in cell wall biosynthesis
MIDGFNLAMPRGTGVATYGFNLAHVLRGMGIGVEGIYGLGAPFNRKLREIVFYESLGGEYVTRPARSFSLRGLRETSLVVRPKAAREIPLGKAGRVESRQFSHRLPEFERLFTSPDLFEQATRHFKRYGQFLSVRVPNPPDIAHWTYPLPVRLRGACNVYTLHDLVPLRLPHTTLDNKRHYYKLIRACVRKGDHICTVSEASRRDVEMFFPEARDKITNTYQAVHIPPSLVEISESDVATSLETMFGLPYKGYFLFFGAIEPKKNVHRLIEAYLSIGTRTPLVIVGTRAWGGDAELRLLQKDEIQPLRATFRNVRRIDYLPRQLLLRLVRGAKAVAFPSLYEGFGLPALEAMMLGTPVLTSNSSSLPEIVGQAAITVDPYNVGEIAAALRRLDGEEALRSELSEAGKARAAEYDMASYQQRLAGMYEQVMK